MEQYPSVSWPALCAEVAKLTVERGEGEPLELPTAELRQGTRWAQRARKTVGRCGVK
jgi:hypothetical protein